jgi:hypothetical protein
VDDAHPARRRIYRSVADTASSPPMILALQVGVDKDEENDRGRGGNIIIELG